MLNMLVSDFLMNFFKIHHSFLHFFISTKKITFNYFIGLNSLGPSTLLERARVHSCRWQLGIKFDCCTDNNQMCLGLPCGGGGVLLLLMLQIIDWHNNCIQ